MTRRNNLLFRKQRGVSLLAAIFLLTGMSLLGALLTRLLTVGIAETMQEWYASQALYAAESGVSWRMYGLNPDAAGVVVIPGQSTFTVAAVDTVVGGQTLRVITSTGMAGPGPGSILASRTIVVTLMIPFP